ncbi:hypothetical protein [Neobacillus kokaensis]|uniref:Uncharacterized protein n=1 Tax=Neobacillus kokaensis TaxID=2759023 RepID=A0ABQ3NB16_9BACI|nr:hypothetical protein [Neobacillus kokaensis]GHI01101.1 hypothetical protein AM1BK_46430 [Neobacillus kokaensis]
MSLFDLAYSQEGLAQTLAALHVPLDGTMEIPWMIDSTAILDRGGNIVAVATDNVFNGTTITGTDMNVIGYTSPNAFGGETIYNGSFENIGFTTDNVFGGHYLFNEDMALESISFDTPIGKTLFSSDMELLGIIPEYGNKMFQPDDIAGPSLDHASSYDSFSSYIHDSFHDFGASLDHLDGLDLLGHFDVSALDGLDFLDWM